MFYLLDWTDDTYRLSHLNVNPLMTGVSNTWILQECVSPGWYVEVTRSYQGYCIMGKMRKMHGIREIEAAIQEEFTGDTDIISLEWRNRRMCWRKLRRIYLWSCPLSASLKEALGWAEAIFPYLPHVFYNEQEEEAYFAIHCGHQSRWFNACTRYQEEYIRKHNNNGRFFDEDGTLFSNQLYYCDLNI